MSGTLRGPRVAALLVAIVLFAVCHVGGADDAVRPPAPTDAYSGYSPEAQTMFAWLDTLGYPDVRARPFVRVNTGWLTEGTTDARPITESGLLLNDTDTAISVLQSDLGTRSYLRNPGEANERKRVSYQSLNLAAQATVCLRYLQKAVSGDEKWNYRAPELEPMGSRSNMTLRSRALILAWACARNDLSDLARSYLDIAPKLPVYDQRAQLPVRELLGNELALAKMWSAVTAFGDPKVTRAELLRRFSEIIAKYPGSSFVKGTRNPGLGAGDYARLLRQMVSEDDAHARTAKPSGKPAAQERIADLIYQLRDQNGHQWGQPGACDIFDDPRGETSPAHQLVKLGYAAVSQLIQTLDDRRFTRSVGFARSFFYSHHVLRVGDCAEAILERIAGRSFWQGDSTDAAMTKDDQTAATRARIVAWWAGFQRKGERQILLEGAAAGDRSSIEQAKRLLDHYPAAAGSAILRGIGAAQEAWVRGQLIHLAGSAKGPDIPAFLVRAIKADRDLGCRVAVAKELLTRGDKSAVPAMIAEWVQLKAPEKLDYDKTRGVGPLVIFLIGAGGPDAVRALDDGLDGRPQYIRQMVVDACSEDDPFMWDWGWRPPGAPPKGKGPVASPKALAAIEALLVRRLDDRGETDIVGTHNRLPVSHPRICDLAAGCLKVRWPAKYAFESSAPQAERDSQIAKCKSVWRAQHSS